MKIRTMTAAALAALMAATAGQAMAQSGYGHGDPTRGGSAQRDYGDDRDFGRGGDHRFSDGDYGRFSYGDFESRGRFYQGGDIRARFERIQHFVQWQVRSGRINRREARQAEEMLQGIRWQTRQFRRDGRLSQRERSIINMRLDRVVNFLRNARRDNDDPRDYRR